MKRLFSIFCSIALGAMTAQAQTVNEVNDSIDSVVIEEEDGSSETIDLPEGMTLDIDTLLQQWSAEKYLTIDSASVNGDSPSFNAEIYKERLRHIPAVMELPYNEIVQKFIDKYANRLRRSVAYMLGASNFYVPIFEDALDYYGVPLELKNLPVIESALDPTAVSRAGAVGLWQFMLSTAKRYDLEVNSLVDERRDPVKSSYAAAKYLKDLYEKFGDWNLVIAAYNCGPNNVTKAIQRADGEKDYWKIYPYLPRETRGYVPAFIAANYIMNYYCEHDIVPMRATYPIDTDTLMIDRDLNLQQVADLCNIDIKALKALNPQYRTNVVPGGVKLSSLRLPADMVNQFIDMSDTIYNHRASELLPRRSVVEVNMDDEAATRKTATRKQATRSRSSQSRKTSRTRTRTTTIRQGDTLIDIARRNGTTVKKLQRLNGIKGTSIRAGNKIRVR